jgi:CPA1 family monovalent cation:H+ antiporter
MLGLAQEGGDADGEEEARVRAAHAALARLEELASGEPVPDDVQDQLRGAYQQRLDAFTEAEASDGRSESASETYKRLRRELIAVERAAAVSMREDGEIGSEVMRRLERDLDLEESRLEG